MEAWQQQSPNPAWVGQDLVDKYAGECAAVCGGPLAATPSSNSKRAPEERTSVTKEGPHGSEETREAYSATDALEHDLRFLKEPDPAAGGSPSVTLLGNIGKERGTALKQQSQNEFFERRLKEKKRVSTSSATSASSSAASWGEEDFPAGKDLPNLIESNKQDGEAEEEGDEIIIDGVFSSEGSKLHAKGQCKPCAFFHTTGCQTGESCKFCHLCPPREVQRRKQIRRRIQREILHRTETALLKAGVPQHHHAADPQHQQRQSGVQGGMLGAAWAQARYHPVMNAFGAVSLAPFAPMATPMLHAYQYLGAGGFPGSYMQQPEAPAGSSSPP